MTRRPVVALTCYLEPASWGVWRDVPAVLVPAAYVVALRDAGARAVLLPPEQGLTVDDAQALLAGVDGLVVAGGADVDASRYGAVPHPLAHRPRDDRDDSEIALVTAAMRADLPLLGICRGMQVMAVAAGGCLDQHLPDLVGHHGHSPAVGAYGRHAATGWADDGVVEALEAPGARLRVGVQWHPEVGEDSRLIDAFVAALR
jgi:putative glutamine amidotransferase